ncbi:ferric siderophore synthetase subunit F [Pseudoalteromonas sp. CO348]|uniref:condensation domain-containing protein n=1 Tax=Pseudoalteromonas TaxID=53246 RepID=UPI001023C5C2|nr:MULTISPECIES: condensation domain-containing protein [Pseudoalteromonas]MCG7541363.1 condensation domain-containing protein [Pseudoalteromonas sp. OF7H-1]MCG9767054.1 condensation domain-containing protein [Pseudoalteromonas piscicida]QZO13103.1 ferric siderophore synthetase subunit F [Pseudoalteromonas piscicida]RZG10227.1 ferric siderophore synthetase subunit F [Pseudoalteromonas sp. CO348]
MALPLTASQHAMWLLHTISGQGNLFNVAECLEFQGKIDAEQFSIALHHVFGQSDLLRSNFIHNDDFIPSIVVGQSLPLLITEYLDHDIASLAEFMPQQVAHELAKSFDLSSGCLMRFKLVRTPSQDYCFIVAHHIVLDGFGFGLFHQALSRSYQALNTGKPLPNCHFASQQQLLDLHGSERYQKQLSEAASSLNEWLDEYPVAQSFSGSKAAITEPNQRYHFALARTQWQTLQSAANLVQATPSEILLSVVAIVLAAKCNSPKVTLGLVMMNRQDPVEFSCPTVQSNVLPLPLTLPTSGGLADVAKYINRQIKRVKPLQCYRVEHLKRDRKQQGKAIEVSGPTVNILPFTSHPRYGEVKSRSHILSAGTTDDFMLQIYLNGDDPVQFDIDYNPARYSPELVVSIAEAMQEAANLWSNAPSLPYLSVIEEMNNVLR